MRQHRIHNLVLCLSGLLRAPQVRTPSGWLGVLILLAVLALGLRTGNPGGGAEHEAAVSPSGQSELAASQISVPLPSDAVHGGTQVVERGLGDDAVRTMVPWSVRAMVTAYCPCTVCCGPKAIGRTSTGRDAYRYPGVAADPKAIPYGHVVNIPGVGPRQVDDTGGAMRRSWQKGVYHLDLRFRNHQDAVEWGRKWMQVEVYAQARP
jgi:3D (Asp-Asp-Asp) domain-containing protein